MFAQLRRAKQKSSPKDSAARITEGHARLMAVMPHQLHEACVANTTPNPKWLVLLKAASQRLQHEDFALNMVRWGSAQLLAVMQLFALVESAANMVAVGSALLTTVPRPSMQEVGVLSMAVATRKCARWKAAALLQ